MPDAKDEAISQQTRAMCETSAGYEPYVEWRRKVGQRMTPFVRAAAPIAAATATA